MACDLLDAGEGAADEEQGREEVEEGFNLRKTNLISFWS